MTENWDFLGSRWWKIDFHTHTPISADYGHAEDSFKDIEAKEWIQNAMESGLDCVVVTDHNSGGWIDILKAQNNELKDNNIKPPWYRNLTIFPGVEITVANSSSRVHLIAIFGPTCDSQKVTGVLGACGITSDYGDPSISTITSFMDTVKKIQEAGGIAIPAHIDGRQGLLENINSMPPELEKSLGKIFAAEFCELEKFNNVEPALKKKLDLLAKVAGSDAHKPSDIGKRYSWIKMSKPSIEGLRLALLHPSYYVKNQIEDPNQLPDIFLSKLTIKNMRHCGRINGQPFVTKLYPHFNSIIGGRGAGKSTILESIRIAARRDQNLETEAPRAKDNLDKFMQLSQNKGVMLNDTEILLEVHRRGKKYQLRWRFDGGGAVLEEESNNTWQKIETGDLKERFPINIFSQKQINELASNPRGLLEVIDRSPEVNHGEWQARWESIKSQFLQLRERRRELQHQVAGEEQIRAKLKDVEGDLKQYEEKGHAEILKRYQKCSQQKNTLPDDQVFNDLSSGIRELSINTGLSDFPEHLFDEQNETTMEIKDIHEQTGQELQKIREALNKLASGVDALKAKREKDIFSSKWYQEVKASVTAYEDLVKEYGDKKSQLSISLYGEWVQQRNQLQQQLKRLDSVRKDIETTEKQIEESLGKLQELRMELLQKRRDFLNTVVGTNSFVRMELVQYGDVSTLESEYRSLLNLEEGKFVSSIYDQENKQGLLWAFNKWEEANIPDSGLPQFISQIKADTFSIATGQSSSNHAAFSNRLKKLLETQPATFDQLDAWWPEDMLRVKYSKDPSSNKFDDLEKGSAGQKAAALLAFLLSHGNEPLIIDQPEDDLDNALIYDLIVKQIHENKNRRQLIIATHNPNIVVNGDSELVHILKYDGGQVKIDQQGGLEESSIRESICNIMEGGRQAFERRYRRMVSEN